VELKQIYIPPFGAAPDGLNRTKVELKLSGNNINMSGCTGLNRTKVELKQGGQKNDHPRRCKFESNQSGIETQQP